MCRQVCVCVCACVCVYACVCVCVLCVRVGERENRASNENKLSIEGAATTPPFPGSSGGLSAGARRGDQASHPRAFIGWGVEGVVEGLGGEDTFASGHLYRGAVRHGTTHTALFRVKRRCTPDTPIYRVATARDFKFNLNNGPSCLKNVNKKTRYGAMQQCTLLRLIPARLAAIHALFHWDICMCVYTAAPANSAYSGWCALPIELSGTTIKPANEGISWL